MVMSWVIRHYFNSFFRASHIATTFPNVSMEKVEPMTLKGWLKERVEAGDAVPLDLFGAYISQRATIKRSK